MELWVLMEEVDARVEKYGRGRLVSAWAEEGEEEESCVAEDWEVKSWEGEDWKREAWVEGVEGASRVEVGAGKG